MEHKDYRGYTFLFVSQLMVGINIVGAKFLTPAIPIFTLLSFRFFIATMVLWLLYQLMPNRTNNNTIGMKQLQRKDWLFIILQSTCAGILFNLLLITGLHYTDANIAGIITSALPMMITLLAILLLGERLTKSYLFCLITATFGILIIALSKLNQSSTHYSLIGDLLIFLSLIPEALYYIFNRMHPNRLPVLLYAAICNGINTLLSIPFVISSHLLHLNTITLTQWSIICAIGLASGLFIIFWVIGSRTVDNSTAILFTTTMPLSTIAIAWLCLSEDISWTQCLGMLVIIAAIFINVRAKITATKHPKNTTPKA